MYCNNLGRTRKQWSDEYTKGMDYKKIQSRYKGKRNSVNHYVVAKKQLAKLIVFYTTIPTP